MSDDDLRTLIRTEVLADEPPFAMTPVGWREGGARMVRRRRRVRGVIAVVAACVAVTAVVTVPRFGADDDPDPGGLMPDVAQQVLDEFDPETFPQVVDAAVRGALGAAIPGSVDGRIEPTLEGWTRLRPADYAYTDAWTATYDLSATNRLVVVLRHDQSANEGDAANYCRENLDNGEMERCTAETLPDGSVAISSVAKRRYARTGFTRVREEDGPETWWFVRQVANRRDYGFGVIAREYVKAPSLAEADRLWLTSNDELVTVSASPSLVYRMPEGGKRSCNTTFLMPKTEDGFARVVCERTLN